VAQGAWAAPSLNAIQESARKCKDLQRRWNTDISLIPFSFNVTWVILKSKHQEMEAASPGTAIPELIDTRMPRRLEVLPRFVFP
jgi:hypothetical protein